MARYVISNIGVNNQDLVFINPWPADQENSLS